jgi:hypothetical protein
MYESLQPLGPQLLLTGPLPTTYRRPSLAEYSLSSPSPSAISHSAPFFVSPLLSLLVPILINPPTSFCTILRNFYFTNYPPHPPSPTSLPTHLPSLIRAILVLLH